MNPPTVKVEGDVRKQIKDMAVAQLKLNMLVGVQDSPTGVLASIHSQYSEEAVDFVYDHGELEKLTTEIWDKARG